ncbi:MAG: SEC-C domain-containing protein [Lachnospiraceae bacterium]|nr:SEC-C domain-containing protein [Lachnospiraceae bacterium]
MNVFNSLGVPEDQEIQHKLLSNAIENAQKKIENNNFGIRKNLLDFDQVMNDQREIIYAERLRVLNGENMRDAVYKMIADVVENSVNTVIGEESNPESWDLKELNNILLPIVPLEPVTLKRLEKTKKNGIIQQLKEEAVKLYEEKEAQFPAEEQIREIERVVLLRSIDGKWMNHIDDMEQLKQGIGMVAYGQKDPVVEYKMAGYDMFDAMTEAIKEDTVRMLLHLRIEQRIEREQVAKVTGTNKDDTVQRGPKKREAEKIQPNDPCPCGSGKKYKKCCGAGK